MSNLGSTLFSAAACTALVLAFSAPAGTHAPSFIRHVRIGGVPGPAYYSVVDGGYRPIRPAGTGGAANPRAAPQRIADIAN